METIDRNTDNPDREAAVRSVEAKYRRGNRILFDRDSDGLRELMARFDGQKHRTLVMWALDCAQAPSNILRMRYPLENRPANALIAAAAWARGDIKMPEAKRAILAAHAFAKDITNPADIALIHAVGQAASTVHVAAHALGLPFYELTSIVFELGIDHYREAADAKISAYLERLTYWQNHVDEVARTWASFLSIDSK